MSIPKMVMVLTAVALIAMTSCKNDEPERQVQPNVDRTVRASFFPHWGAGSFSLGSDYRDSFGNVVRFSKVRIYVGNMTAVGDDDGSIGDFSEIFLIDFSQSSNAFTLGTVSEKHIHEIEGYIGVDSLRNHADPMLAEAPLNDGTMHWSWSPTNGYKFAVFEGMVDTDNDDVVDSGFIYHLASDKLFTLFELEAEADVDLGETLDMHVEVDLRAVIDGVDIANNLDTHTDNEPALAAQLMSNLAGAFEVE